MQHAYVVVSNFPDGGKPSIKAVCEMWFPGTLPPSTIHKLATDMELLSNPCDDCVAILRENYVPTQLQLSV